MTAIKDLEIGKVYCFTESPDAYLGHNPSFKLYGTYVGVEKREVTYSSSATNWRMRTKMVTEASFELLGVIGSDGFTHEVPSRIEKRDGRHINGYTFDATAHNEALKANREAGEKAVSEFVAEAKRLLPTLHALNEMADMHSSLRSAVHGWKSGGGHGPLSDDEIIEALKMGRQSMPIIDVLRLVDRLTGLR